MKAERLEVEFASRGIASRDGRRLLRAADALALIERAAEEGVPIVGVVGAPLAAANAALPHGLADYSASVARGHGCWENADALIRQHGGTDMTFAFALGDDPIEAV